MRRLAAWIGLSCALAACGDRPAAARRSGAMVATSRAVDAGAANAAGATNDAGGARDAAAAVAAPARPDPALAADLRALAALRLTALEAIAPTRDRWPSDPGPPLVWHIPAVGPCQRPAPAQAAALQRRIERWIDARVRPERRRGSLGGITVGCVEARGVVVNVQADLHVSDTRRWGHWWTLRVGPRRIQQIAHVRSTAIEDYMEWAGEANVAAIGLADLDRDGALDLLLAHDATEGGAPPNTTLSVITAAGERTLGRHPEAVSLAAWQPPARDGVAVVRLEAANRPTLHRCIAATGVWHPCPAGDLAARHDDAVAVAGELALRAPSEPLDRDLVERLLVRLDVPAAERAALVARAAVPSIAAMAKRIVEDRGVARAARTDDEQAAAARAAEDQLATALRDALGDAPCPAVDARGRAAADQAIRGWIAQHEQARLDALRACGATPCVAGAPATIALRDTCAGPRGAYWLASWRHMTAPPVEHQVLFYASGDAPALVIDAAVLLQDIEGDWLPADDVDLRAKFAIADGAATALVGSSNAPLSGVVDGVVGARTVADARLDWSWQDGHLELWMNADSLARTRQPPITYWHATRAGVEAVTRIDPSVLAAAPSATDAVGRLLEPLERAAQAETVARYVDAQRLGDLGYRAEVRAALAILGAPAALLERLHPLAP